jgi:hypothetical protein
MKKPVHTSSGAGLQNLCAPAMPVLLRVLVLIGRQWPESLTVSVSKTRSVDANLPHGLGSDDANDHVVHSNETKNPDSDFAGPFFEGPVTD